MYSIVLSAKRSGKVNIFIKGDSDLAVWGQGALRLISACRNRCTPALASTLPLTAALPDYFCAEVSYTLSSRAEQVMRQVIKCQP